MKILVVGGGGREHAIAWRLAKDSCKPELFCAPGNAGTEAVATNIPVSAEDIPALLNWAKENRPDLTVVGPEAPLCAGLADAFAAEGLRVFGPCKAAAQMEGSKEFAKEVMNAAGVPTAKALVFSDADAAVAALDSFSLPVVIKADGLAAGKGVVIAQTREEAEAAIRDMLVDAKFGKAGSRVLLETFLDGEEASILALVDGEHAVLLPSSQDHKRVYDGDLGPNTGGMGAYSPAPVVTDAMLPEIKEKIILPVVRELRRRGIVYKGVLYAGLMIGKDGAINVLEFNCRFGDPETEAVLPRLGGAFIPALEACIDGTLEDSLVTVRPEAAATVVVAAGGYPGSYAKGTPIEGLADAERLADAVFHAGTKRKDNHVVTSGGRILTVTGLGTNLRTAVAKAYAGVEKIQIEGAHYRHDIAHRAFEREQTAG
ncbi:MAG: phosphoribosylamine--glycine ligase [Kiritimatiellae bacterium]|nr:phosphoribosylamine--glycine ligase [Kiritimatiellia bacterium]